jgi:hypothetical protein
MLERFGKLYKKIVSYTLLSILFFISSCTIDNKKYDYQGQYSIIDYVFMSDVDSLLSVYLSEMDYSKLKKKIWIGIHKGSYGDSIDYSISVHVKRSEIPERIELKEVDGRYVVDNMIDYILTNTNHFAVINGGEYVIPIITSFDQNFVGYGVTDGCQNTFTISGSSFYIQIIGNDVVHVSRYGRDVTKKAKQLLIKKKSKKELK